MKTLKLRYTALFLALLMIFSFAACTGEDIPLDNSEAGSKDTSKETVSKTESEDSSETVSEDDSSIADIVDINNIRNGEALYINEIMVDNEILFSEGFCDWIELYNPTDSDIELSEYFLSDDVNDVRKSQLPSGTVAAGGYAVIRCGQDVSFSLSKDGETLFLLRKDGYLADYVKCPELPKNVSYVPNEGETKYATPGFANTYDGYKDYRSTLPRGLVINEIVSSNSSIYAVDGEYYDLIELKNMSDKPVNLGDYCLSDDFKDLAKWKLPDVTLDAGKIYVVIASGNGDTHATFKISSDGEEIYLKGPDGQCVDVMPAVAIPNDRSYGRSGNELVYFAKPTIGAENGSGEPSVTSAPVADKESGIYTSAIQVTLSGEGDIYYTLDGSKPSKSSKKYDSPITISQNTALRVIAYSGNKIESEVRTYSYFFNTEYTLPILKISGDSNDFWGASTGIYVNYSKSWEKEINLAFLVDGKEEFSVDCGISMFGSSGRAEAKKSFKVNFRGKYGASSLNYKVFENLDITSFDALVIRGGSQDWYFSGVRDEVLTSLAGDGCTSLLTQAYRPVILYINEEYMGIYFIRERINQEFVASHEGTKAEEVAIIRYGYSLEKGTKRDKADWDALISFIKKNDMTKAANYEYVCSKLDVNSLAEWFISRSYAGDRDIDNIRYCRASPDSKWKLIYFDLDLGFFGTKSPLTKIGGTLNNYNVPFYYLCKNAQFRDLYLTLLGQHLKTTYSDETVIAKIDYIKAQLDADIPANQKRWEDAYISEGKGSYFTYNFWISQLNYLKRITNNGTKSRTEELISDAVSLFKLTEAEKTKYFGG